ncbi:hypothetical protein ACS0TY_033465 [Phlomoides rotata]
MEPHALGTGNDVKGKASRGRRSWSRVEEDALIGCLIDIVNDGWKADNGFKAGFQRELEKGMRKIFPGTDLVANPHINSKIHVWKKEYSALNDLLSKSGVVPQILISRIKAAILPPNTLKTFLFGMVAYRSSDVIFS